MKKTTRLVAAALIAAREAVLTTAESIRDTAARDHTFGEMSDVLARTVEEATARYRNPTAEDTAGHASHDDALSRYLRAASASLTALEALRAEALEGSVMDSLRQKAREQGVPMPKKNRNGTITTFHVEAH